MWDNIHISMEEIAMSITIDLKMLAIAVVIIAVVIITVYLVKLIKKLIVTLDHTNKILEDVEVISEIASNRSKDVDGIITDVSESVSELSSTIKEKQDVLAIATYVIKAITSIKNFIAKATDKK